MAKGECTITIKPLFDTEYLEIQRAFCLRQAQLIQETIERLSRYHDKANDADEPQDNL